MKKSILIIAFFICVCSAGRLCFAEEPSFDCLKAKTEVEKLICSDNELSMIDRNLSITYSEVSSRLDESGKADLKKNQIEWIKGRTGIINEIQNQGLTQDEEKKQKTIKLKASYDKRMTELVRMLNPSLGKKNAENEVWGLKLPLPKEVADNVINTLYVYKDKKSNVYVQYHFQLPDNETGAIFYDFTHNRIIEDLGHWGKNDSEADRQELINKFERIDKNYTMVREYNSREDGIYFHQSNNLKFARRHVNVDCGLPSYSYFEISNMSGQIVDNKLLAVSSEDKHKLDSYGDCHIMEWKPSPLMGGKHSIFVRTFSFSPSIYVVDKNTIIIHGMGSPYVIRFNGDLTSPYIENNPEIMWIDKDRFSSLSLAAEKEAKNIFDENNYGVLKNGKCCMEYFDDALTKYVKEEKKH